MKILMALSRFPYPTDKGDKLRAYYQLKHLSINHDIFLICLTSELPPKKDIQHIQSFCKQLTIIKTGLLGKLFELMTAIFSPLPFQVHFFKSQKMKDEINALLKKEKIDVVYVQLIRLLENIPFSAGPKYYLDFMDALSEGMNKRRKFSKWYEKLLVKNEAERLRKYELQALEKFDGYSIITQADADAISSQHRFDIIPNGVNQAFLQAEQQEVKEFDIIFTGNMGYHPNVQACKFLVKQIVPVLAQRGVLLRICLAGTSPSSEVLALRNNNIIVTGYVDDITWYLARTKIFVAPLFSGSGLQNKLLESMAMGLATVTTPLTNNALKAKPGEEIIICDSKESFAEKIVYLMKHENARNELGNRGKEYIIKNFDWLECNKKLELALQNLRKN